MLKLSVPVGIQVRHAVGSALRSPTSCGEAQTALHPVKAHVVMLRSMASLEHVLYLLVIASMTQFALLSLVNLVVTDGGRCDCGNAGRVQYMPVPLADEWQLVFLLFNVMNGQSMFICMLGIAAFTCLHCKCRIIPKWKFGWSHAAPRVSSAGVVICWSSGWMRA